VRLAPSITRADQLPRVDIIYAYADADGALADAAVKAGAKALVIAGFPTGAATPAQYELLNRLKAQGVLVIMSNRGGLGRINTANEYISADNLTPQKARVLTMLALAKNPSPAFVSQVLATH
jgi:L-asparaginase